MEEVVVWVAKSLIGKETLKKIIEFLLYENADSITYFVAEAKKYRPYIEPQDAPIQKQLLSQMIDDWLSNEGGLSEETKIAILEAIDPEKFSGQSD